MMYREDLDKIECWGYALDEGLAEIPSRDFG